MSMNKNLSRYSRQMILKNFGEEAQQKLLNAKALVVGAGGLGCPVLLYLTAAGVGTIGIADDDAVALTNLHRQVLFGDDDIGKLKVDVAAKKLKQQNSSVNIITHQTRITNANAFSIIKDYDVVIDGTDNFASKYLLNDACVLLDKPLVYGAISKFEGQVAVFNYKKNEFENPVNYRDLFPEPLKNNEVENCEEAGVLGVLAGMTGSMQASETIKIITGIGYVLKNKLLTFDILMNQFYEVSLCKNKLGIKLLPKTEKEFLKMDYEFLCDTNSNIQLIDAATFNKMIEENHSIFIDVREEHELPAINFQHKKIPFSIFEKEMKNIKEDKIVLFCQTGKRSLKAAKMLSTYNKNNREIFSLKNGIFEVINS